MRIVSMTATFGKLDGETLEFHSGLNVLSAPNEWGKSTWCAFLVAMLYGIDTRERSSRDQLAGKEKYMPWSGKPMEGTLRVIHRERDITIQRRTRGRVPMGEFLAYETGTGLPIRELTADNCGQVLLGVEKSVFQRTGFLRFSDLPVKQDEALRRRLNSIVTTGDESGSAELLGTKLRELKNRCRYNHTGLIPECQNQIRDLQKQLWDRQTLQKQYDGLNAELESQTAQMEQLENHRNELAWQDAQADQERVRKARAAVNTAIRLATALREKYTELPDRKEVEQKIRQTKERLEDEDLTPLEPPGTSLYLNLTATLAVVLLISAVLFMDRGLLIPCIVLGVAMAVAALVLADRRYQARLWFDIEQTQRSTKREELTKVLQGWEEKLRMLNELDTAQENVYRTRVHLRDLEAMARRAERPEQPDELTLSREETMHAIGELSQQLSHGRMQLAQYRGRMDDLPDTEILEARLALAKHRLSELEKVHQAIGYAQNALDAARQELQRRFAPRITLRAGQLLSRLTGGAYDRIAISEDLTIHAAREDETTLRTAQWRSEGTGDQMYLALRLAVWEVLAPESPMILDDALVRFDRERMEQAMDLLSELGRKRQILLFSCQEREKEYLLR